MQRDEFEKVSLANLANGAAIERFDAELTRVLDNIADPNTKVKQARTVTLTVAIVPSADRTIGVVSIKAASKLAGLDTVDHAIELVQEGRKQVAYQRSGKQGDLGLDNVTPLVGEKGRADA